MSYVDTALYPLRSRPAVGPTQPPSQWISGFFPGAKAADAWRWLLTFIQRPGWEWVELYFYSPYKTLWHGYEELIVCVSIYSPSARNAPLSLFKERCMLTLAVMENVKIVCTHELMNLEFVWSALVLMLGRCGVETRLA